MSSLGGFAKKMRRASKAVCLNADKLVKDVADGILVAVVTDTPVDTGQARSNWQVNLNSPANGTRTAFVPGKKGSTGLDNIIAAVEVGTNHIDQYNGGEEIHITNNLSYIGDLNDGTSKQAPPGYVQDAILEAIGKIDAARYKILHNIEE